jgi:hypothetical protein
MGQCFVLLCRHAFRADRLVELRVDMIGISKWKRPRELQKERSRSLASGKRREDVLGELDEPVAGARLLRGY